MVILFVTASPLASFIRTGYSELIEAAKGATTEVTDPDDLLTRIRESVGWIV